MINRLDLGFPSVSLLKIIGSSTTKVSLEEGNHDKFERFSSKMGPSLSCYPSQGQMRFRDWEETKKFPKGEMVRQVGEEWKVGD